MIISSSSVKMRCRHIGRLWRRFRYSTKRLFVFCVILALLTIAKTNVNKETNETQVQQHVPSKKPPFLHPIPSKLEEAGQLVRDCVFDQFTRSGNLSEDILTIIPTCLTAHFDIPRERWVILCVRGGEKKLFWHYGDKAKGVNCSYLTIGIGRTIAAEREMLGLYPNCKMFGLDPAYLQGKWYLKVGTFVNAGLAQEDGFAEMSLRTEFGGYRRNKTYVISPQTLMKDYIFKKLPKHPDFHIHFATMDIEAYEFTMLQHIGSVWMNAGLRVCQLDVEIHRSPLDSPFQEFLKDLLTNQIQYIPISSRMLGWGLKLALINPNLYCDRLFDFSALIKHS